MEYERALFRVYDRTLDAIRLDQPVSSSPRPLAQRFTKPSAICAGVQRCLLGTVATLLLCLLVLHAAFVGEGGCLHAALRDAAWGELTPATLPPNASAPELMASDDILQIRVSDAAHPGGLRAGGPNASGAWAEFSPDYRFVRDAPLMYVDKAFVKKHRVRLLNVTLAPSCLTRGRALHGALLDGLVGYDAVLVNQLLYAEPLRARAGLLQNVASRELWGWGAGYVPPAAGRSFGDALLRKCATLLSTGLAFFFVSTVTALVVRMLISSGVVVMFPVFFALRRLGWPLDLHILTLSYPWLGLPVELLRAQNKPVGPLIGAHLCRVVVLYSMYEACQLAWAMWLYDKPLPSGLVLWVYGVAMVWEYFAMIYVRCATSMRWLPRLALLYFAAFHVYFYSYAYGFCGLALLASFLALCHAMCFCVVAFEVPASNRGEISLEQPRALTTELPWPAWDAALPPSWSLFLPLNARATSVYSGDDAPGGDNGGGDGDGGDGGGARGEGDGDDPEAGGAGADDDRSDAADGSDDDGGGARSGDEDGDAGADSDDGEIELRLRRPARGQT